MKIDFDNTSLDKMAISERAEDRKSKDNPTYKDIQNWTEENYGFKVHPAYIAEVKRDLGLPMYDRTKKWKMEWQLPLLEKISGKD